MSKELEALKRIKREAGTPHFSSLYDIDMWNEDFTTIAIALKALEIIKEKMNVLGRMSFLPMSQEDYDLLNEVL